MWAPLGPASSHPTGLERAALDQHVAAGVLPLALVEHTCWAVVPAGAAWGKLRPLDVLAAWEDAASG